MQQLVVTAVGHDRPGLVDELTGALLDAGANVADSRMVNLRGRFAIIMLVEAAGADRLRGAIADIESKTGLTVTVTTEADEVRDQREGVPFHLRTYAMDQPGIVHRIAHVLSLHGVNIEELQTRLSHAAHTGTPLFTMDLRMTVPPSVSMKTLREELESLCDSLNCDVDIDPA